MVAIESQNLVHRQAAIRRYFLPTPTPPPAVPGAAPAVLFALVGVALYLAYASATRLPWLLAALGVVACLSASVVVLFFALLTLRSWLEYRGRRSDYRARLGEHHRKPTERQLDHWLADEVSRVESYGAR